MKRTAAEDDFIVAWLCLPPWFKGALVDLLTALGQHDFPSPLATLPTSQKAHSGTVPSAPPCSARTMRTIWRAAMKRNPSHAIGFSKTVVAAAERRGTPTGTA